MKLILAVALILGSVVATSENITCWDVCRWKCKARYGKLTDAFVKTCDCPCNTQCEKSCVQYGLGLSCKFQCGCFQKYNFDRIVIL